MLSVRPSVNLHALPIEQVVAKMKASHLQLLDLLTGDLKFAGVPAGALTPLTSFKVQADQQAADAFNSTHKYRDATNQALERQAEVFKLLADPREAFCEKMESRKVRKTALICARAGEHKMAIRLLLEASKKAADELEASKKAADEERTRQGGASGVAPDATDGKLVVSAPRLGDNGRPQGPTHSGSVMRHHLRPIARPPEMTDDEKDAHPGAAELYQIACTMIEEGLPQPWPATFVALGPDSAPEHAHSRRGGELGGGGPPSPGRAVIEEPTRLPKALFKKLVQHIVKEQQPFQVGAKVRRGPSRQHHWRASRLPSA